MGRCFSNAQAFIAAIRASLVMKSFWSAVIPKRRLRSASGLVMVRVRGGEPVVGDDLVDKHHTRADPGVCRVGLALPGFEVDCEVDEYS